MIQKIENFLNKKKYVKIAKRKHAFKDFASFYNIDIFNRFNPELQL